MYMNLCDEQTLIIKFNLTKEAILKMPEKEINYIYKNFAELIFKFIFYNDEEEKKCIY